MAKKFDFDKILAKFAKTQQQIPREVARLVVNHSKEAFRDGGFTDNTLAPWAPRKRGNRADRRTGKTRALLVDSGNLRRSIRASRVSFREVRVGAYGIEYATYHNQGVAGRLPKRKFLGESAVLRRRIRLAILTSMKKVFE
jgi:phage gpG-like protein